MINDQITRYEAKYVIDERTYREIRKAITGICSVDEHVDENGRYIVNNLYFDTTDLRFYYDTKHKQYNRFKPRVRYYGTDPKDYLWVELKHKVRNVTWKTRRRIDVAQWPRILESSRSLDESPAIATLADSFESTVVRFQAQPILQVRYVREPYVSDLDAYGRITFDRCLTYRPAYGSYDLVSACDLTSYDDSETMVHGSDDSPVLLEIKTETHVPLWVVRLIQRFELTQRGFSKYCYAVDHAIVAATCGNRISALI
jgi:hypothetical protein